MAQAGPVRDAGCASFGNVPEGVGAVIAERSGIGGTTDPEGIEHEKEGAWHRVSVQPSQEIRPKPRLGKPPFCGVGGRGAGGATSSCSRCNRSAGRSAGGRGRCSEN